MSVTISQPQEIHMKKILLPVSFAIACLAAQASTPTPIKVIIPQNSASGLAHIFMSLESYAAKNNITLVPVYKPGAGGKIGLDYASGSNGDVILLSTISDLADNNKLSEFRNVSAISNTKLVMVSSMASNVRNSRELIEIERTTPGKLKWAYSTSAQLTLINAVADQNRLDKSKMMLVPYGTIPPGPTQAVASGDVDITFTLPTVADALVKSNKLRVVELEDGTKNKLDTKVNAVGFYLPKNSSQNSTYWTKFVNDFLNDSQTKTSFGALGISSLPTGPENLGMLIREWSK
jgi:tripartite-type tricarboxylate transporter receptor subunit TctC